MLHRLSIALFACLGLLMVLLSPQAVSAEQVSVDRTDSWRDIGPVGFSAFYLGSDVVTYPGNKSLVVAPLGNTSKLPHSAWIKFEYYCWNKGSEMIEHSLKPFKVRVRGNPSNPPLPQQTLKIVPRKIRVSRKCAHDPGGHHDGEYVASIGRKRGDYWGSIGNTFRIGKKFTRRNIRHNLSLRAGHRKAKKYQAHHTMPVKFEHRFKKRHLNIHNPKYLRWWCSKKGVKGNHQSKAREYNRRWAHFFKKHPHASKKKVLKFRSSITRKYKKFYKCPGTNRLIESSGR